MKLFFGGYLLLLVGVFVLWSIEPLHRGEESSSVPAETPFSVLASASSSIKQAITASVAKSASKPAATPKTEIENSSPATATLPALPEPTATSTATTTATEPLPKKETISSTTPSQSELIGQEIELGIHEKINEERAKAGLPPLTLNSALSALARAHSEDMLVNNYFAHDNASGCSSSCRLTASGYDWSASGENIYVMSGYSIAVDKAIGMAIESWMQSPGHRANILNASFTQEGIGIAFSGIKLYATEDFALPR